MMNSQLTSEVRVWKNAGAATVMVVFLLLGSFCFGQQLTGTLSGTVLDSAGAVVPDAKVIVTNDASGDERTTVSNSSGRFSVTALPPGDYSATVSAKGFKAWKISGVTLTQGDSRNLSNIMLQIGGVNETVEIMAGADAVVPDTAEVSATLNEKMVDDLLFSGRNAGDLMKLMPGMALNNGGTQGSSFSTKVVGTNSGPVGAYSSNGTQPNGAMAYMLDGANLVDPGNMGTQIANINQDMVSEVKVIMGSSTAEYAKGPVIFQAFSKSGGNLFHGEAYSYARNSALNSIESYQKSQIVPGGLSAAAAAPSESYYYMGGNIGGPILIPFTDFNKSRKKLFFWAGYEYMRQHPAGSIINYNVPTMAQKGSDPNNPPGYALFDTLAASAGQHNTWGYAYNLPNGNLPAGSIVSDSTGNTACGGSGQPACTQTAIPLSALDPNLTGGTPDGKHGILGLYPDPNETASQNNGWNNYQYVQTTPQNRWEATGKVDYAINDNTKISVSYSRQIENDQHPISVWWAPQWTLPYPSSLNAATTSQVVLTNFTHVFSPTTTNEFVFTLARYINPSVLSNPGAVDRGNLGFNVQGLFGHTTKQMPNIYGPWGGAFPDFREFSYDGGFNGNAFGGLKRDPALYDNFTKVIRSHTLKTGFYWDTQENIQSSSGNDNGIYNLGWGANGTGNVVSDFILGRAGNYQQQSSVPVQDLKFHQWAIYAQDSWKAARRLTLNYGLRFDHLGQWYGPSAGAQVWDPASYVNGTPANPYTVNNTGLLWNAIDKSIPQSGFKSPLFYYEPRLGFAYDIFGNGKSILRGGYSVFRYQVSIEVGGAFNGPLGSFQYTTPSITNGFDQIEQFTPPSSVAQNGSGISALQKGDDRTPKTQTWNLSFARTLPWRSVVEMSYVGNRSTNEWINGGNDKVFDQNGVPIGGYFTNDPYQSTPIQVSPNPLTCNSGTPGNNALVCTDIGPNGLPLSANYNTAFNANHYRPLTNYQDVYLLSHGAFANYNSLQVTWQKQSGPITFFTNYTFGKVLGIRDGSSDNGAGNGKAVDPFNLNNNYAPLAYDHTHIINFSYSWNMPMFIHGNKALGTVVNGWQLSGYTTYQSGAPLQPSTGGNLNAIYNSSGLSYPTVANPTLPDNTIRMPNGLESTTVNPASWFGTDQNGGGYTVLVPKVTCDPRRHGSGVYVNPNCFTIPAYGEQGTLVFPYIRNPGYFDSDLALFKNFKITERQKLQFRVSATNFLNHPLRQFGLAGQRDEQLDFTNNYTVGGQPVTGLSATNTNTEFTGKPEHTTGQRIMTFTVKYYF